MTYTAIIVDDEKLARDLILEYLELHQDIEVSAQCENGEEAIKIINSIHPDIVFLDIRMPGKGGFDVLEKLDYFPIIIFSTANSKYALKAFEVSAVDYLLKPYSQERFDKAISNAKIKKPELSQQVARLLETIKNNQSKNFPKQIFIKTNDRIVPLDVSQIEHINGEEDYVRIHADSKTYLADQTLRGFISILDPDMFIRIHRSHIINFRFIKEIQKTFKGNYSVHMKSGARLPVGRTYQKQLKNHIL